MKYLILLTSLLTSSVTFGQSFYDLNTVQKIEITFSQSNWDQLMDNEKAGAGNYIMAQSVTINGQTFDSVGVKYKGNSTYKANQTKNPLHIELDTYKDHIYESYTDMKLSNVANDPSFVREVLSYQILGQYMDAPLSNYANVYINGNLIGLYSNSESISKKFVQSRFGSKENTFIKCNPPAGAGPGSSDYPNLVYQGTDSSKYYASYEMKSNHGWDELIHLCDTLSNHLNDIEKILDVDRALWMLAFNNVLVNLDSYSGGFAQNYYLYRDDNGRFIPIVWDLNESFGRFSMTGTGNLNSTTAKQQMTHLLHENDANYPLIKQLLNNPMYKRMYLAHIKTMLSENFGNGSYLTSGGQMQTLIDAFVQADNNKFFTYANFKDNLNADISGGGPGPGGSGTPGIGNLMNGRNTYLMGLTDFKTTEPTIIDIKLSNMKPSANDTVFITATISNNNAAYLGFRSNSLLPFSRIQMYDDGMHGDGKANDGVFGSSVVLKSYSTQYYIYAENNTIGKFSPERAEHEFHSINTVGNLFINELMASNKTTYADPFGNYDDWIEIYNPTAQSLALGDYYLSDDSDTPNLWKLPSESIAAGGFKIIWAAGDTTLSTSHTNFKLSKSGESLGLYKMNGGIFETVDLISFDTQWSDYSLGRESDGASNWIKFEVATPNSTNIIIEKEPDGIVELNSYDILVYPNPYRNQLHFENLENNQLEVTVFDATGATLLKTQISSGEKLNWNDGYSKGLRVVKLESENTSKVVKLISQ